ncbi:hypothetical protein JRQ81_016689 [Phrynocephalus forsythii]|uniref:Interleukin n=1 Tax=Phrynocephalus forsythii TaxID=171643 RepID=A0A9Q1B1P8_9SAUR|nr:hypothetical protein JRQ81_016689 [Phrynocephalus forsythii]
MNNYFLISLINEPGVTIFVLCLYLVQVQISADSVWEAVLADWAKIKDAKMDVFLYTVDAPFSSHCSIPVRRCFFDEMQVIMYESQFGNNSTLYNTVNNIIRLINYTLKGTQNIETSQCQKCETFQEKEYKEFMKSFGKNVIRWNRESTRDF